MTLAVRLEGVRAQALGHLLVQVAQLSIALGERVAIIGPNGAGKTTLLRLMGALLTPQQGRVQVLGCTVCDGGVVPRGRDSAAQRRALRRDTGILMQGLHLVPRLSARENVLIGALGHLRGVQAWRSLLRWYPSAWVAQADAALTALGLASRCDTRSDRLSGGERQKVALARVQLQQPRLILADEPTSALDPAATPLVCQALRAATSGPEQTLVTVVHDLQTLPVLASRVIGMAQGRIVWDLALNDVTPPKLQALYGLHRDTVWQLEGLMDHLSA